MNKQGVKCELRSNEKEEKDGAADHSKPRENAMIFPQEPEGGGVRWVRPSPLIYGLGLLCSALTFVEITQVVGRAQG